MRQHAYHTAPIVYYSANYPKPPMDVCTDTNTYQYHCRVYRSFVQRRYFILAETKNSRYTLTWDKTANFPQSKDYSCLLYTSPSPRDLSTSRMPSSA